MRLDVVRSRMPGDYGTLSGLAAEHFGLPDYGLSFWETSSAQRPWWDRSGGDNGKRR
jgi:hypothetical protein